MLSILLYVLMVQVQSKRHTGTPTSLALFYLLRLSAECRVEPGATLVVQQVFEKKNASLKKICKLYLCSSILFD